MKPGITSELITLRGNDRVKMGYLAARLAGQTSLSMAAVMACITNWSADYTSSYSVIDEVFNPEGSVICVIDVKTRTILHNQ